jgi:hypothetical protein
MPDTPTPPPEDGAATLLWLMVDPEAWQVWLDSTYFLGKVQGTEKEAISAAREAWPKFAGRMELRR